MVEKIPLLCLTENDIIKVIKMIKLNKEIIRDKIYACWIGKNIGGTFGGPYEATRDILDIRDFATKKGEPLPNDDLDLQLVWLRAMEEYGPYQMSPQILGEYWINFVGPYWNEYGVAKSNLRAGLAAPLCGEVNNEEWKHSNGAWIRSEIWACLAPGFPQIAMKYAYMDACVDHGGGEGTYAELFTATMESLAFFETDIAEIIQKSLQNIPKASRLYQCIQMVVEGHKKGEAWKTIRNQLVEFCSDIGWFQAPANVAFVILGLLYGEGDFKQSMIYAVNCGDDTDCTAATIGAFLGILYGTSGIPEDWREYVGDRIVNAALTADCYDLPDSCRKLTERVMLLMPVVFKANGVNMEWTNEKSDITYSRELAGADGVSWDMYDRCQCSATSLCSRNPYSFEAFSAVYASGILEMDRAPILKPGETIRLKLRMVNRMVDPRHMYFRLYLPEGWQADEYPKSAFMPYPNQKELAAKGLPQPEFFWEAAVTAGERLERSNRVIIEVSAEGRSVVSLIPVTILG